MSRAAAEKSRHSIIHRGWLGFVRAVVHLPVQCHSHQLTLKTLRKDSEDRETTTAALANTPTAHAAMRAGGGRTKRALAPPLAIVTAAAGVHRADWRSALVVPSGAWHKGAGEHFWVQVDDRELPHQNDAPRAAER